MSERKVLNKYYPPDFDPSKIPKGRAGRNKTFSIRIMSPFNMRCNTCGEYIYKGKKFNSRKENVEDEYYLGLRIFRFYIKCPRCVAEIAFKTDLLNTDYSLEAGAIRLFEAEKLAKQMAEKEMKEKEHDALNPMKVLENRTKASRFEMEQIDALEELRDLNTRHAKVDHDDMIKGYQEYDEEAQRLQEEAEEREILAIFGEKSGGTAMKRLQDDSDASDDEQPVTKKLAVGSGDKPTDILAQEPIVSKPQIKKPLQSWEKSVGGLSSKQSLSNLIVRKKPATATSATATTSTNSNCGEKGNNSYKLSSGEKVKNSCSEITPQTESKCLVNNLTGGQSTSQGSGPSNSVQGTGPTHALGLLGNYSDSDSSESS